VVFGRFVLPLFLSPHFFSHFSLSFSCFVEEPAFSHFLHVLRKIDHQDFLPLMIIWGGGAHFFLKEALTSFFFPLNPASPFLFDQKTPPRRIVPLLPIWQTFHLHRQILRRPPPFSSPPLSLGPLSESLMCAAQTTQTPPPALFPLDPASTLYFLWPDMIRKPFCPRTSYRSISS